MFRSMTNNKRQNLLRSAYCVLRNPLRNTQYALLAVIVGTYLGLSFQGIVSAQDARKLAINQTDADSWPDVTINLSLTGLDGKALPNVDVSQFKVEEKGKQRQVLELTTGPAKSVPLSLVLVLDVSGSMNAQNKLPQAKEAANTFLGSLRPQDSVSLLA